MRVLPFGVVLLVLIILLFFFYLFSFLIAANYHFSKPLIA